MGKYKTETDAYLAWYDRMVKFIADHYDCQIRFPRDRTDIYNMVDGLQLTFNQIDWSCCLTNFCLYQLFSGIKGLRFNSYFTQVQQHIEGMLLEKIKK